MSQEVFLQKQRSEYTDGGRKHLVLSGSADDQNFFYVT